MYWDWLAGFIDGEGCFFLSQTRGVYSARFAIGLRADDAEVLVKARELAGEIGVFKLKHGTRGKENDTVRWETNTIDENLALIAGIDSGIGLQSKKGRDYALWREAVLLMNEHGGGKHSAASARLAEIKESLHAVKKFVQPDSVPTLGRGSRTDKSRTRTGRSGSQFWASEAGQEMRQRRWGHGILPVEEVLADLATGMTQQAVAAKRGISQQSVSRIARGTR